MAITSSQNNQNSGQGAGSVGQGVGRDVNSSIGGLDLSGIGSAKSSAEATSGAVTLGDRILGGNKSSRQFGLVKILVLIAGAAILLKIYKKAKG